MKLAALTTMNLDLKIFQEMRMKLTSSNLIHFSSNFSTSNLQHKTICSDDKDQILLLSQKQHQLTLKWINWEVICQSMNLMEMKKLSNNSTTMINSSTTMSKSVLLKILEIKNSKKFSINRQQTCFHRFNRQIILELQVISFTTKCHHL